MADHVKNRHHISFVLTLLGLKNAFVSIYQILIFLCFAIFCPALSIMVVEYANSTTAEW